jgi:hypothetical protein
MTFSGTDIYAATNRQFSRSYEKVAPPIWVIRNRSGQYFEGDPAPEPRAYGQLDFSHPTRAERREDFIRPKPRAGG